jgi:hypothetical protein
MQVWEKSAQLLLLMVTDADTNVWSLGLQGCSASHDCWGRA